MKTNRILTLCLAGLLLTGSGISFTSCQGDDVDTNQFTGGISLNVFGPCPVARGGELRFIGSGMNQVTAVSIPGCADITDIQVISDREIRVTVPQEAEEGYVILRTPNGDIQTETKITYSEPITLDSFSPTSVLPGETLTITGDYLNLMQKVIFGLHRLHRTYPPAHHTDRARRSTKRTYHPFGHGRHSEPNLFGRRTDGHPSFGE